jgi:hypothetical protein
MDPIMAKAKATVRLSLTLANGKTRSFDVTKTDAINFAEHVFRADSGAAWHAIVSAIENANLTAREDGFEIHSDQWGEIAMSSWGSNADDAGISEEMPSLDHPLSYIYFGDLA